MRLTLRVCVHDNLRKKASADGFDPELIELPMAADGFWSWVKITTNGLWHLPINW